MERRAFLNSFTGPVIAACAVCMGACSKSGTGGNPGTGNFSVDLATNLTAVGSSLVQNGVIVVRLAAANTSSSFTAVQVSCTHEGTSINYNSAAGQFICPNHGSTFTTSGSVTLGPATSSLKLYTVTVTGTTLTVGS